VSLTTATGIFLVVSALWFNTWFAVLSKRFDYPDILRKPTEEILTRFRAGGSALILTWWAFMASGGLLVVSAVLLSRVLDPDAPTAATFVLVLGVLAAFVQVLGLLRWVYLVPALARAHADPDATAADRAAVAVTFRAFHQYLGVGVGEHLGYLLTGAWTIAVGIGIVVADPVGAWLGWVALPVGVGLVIGSAEFLGPNEPSGWKSAEKAIPVLYVAWSVWLVAVGIALIA
jgi:hypothetical protein